MLTGELKAIIISLLQKIVADIQQKRALVTDEILDEYMRPRKLKFDF
jgi:tryptophanyl-tRNA synthetase